GLPLLAPGLPLPGGFPLVSACVAPPSDSPRNSAKRIDLRMALLGHGVDRHGLTLRIATALRPPRLVANAVVLAAAARLPLRAPRLAGLAGLVRRRLPARIGHRVPGAEREPEAERHHECPHPPIVAQSPHRMADNSGS